MKEAEVVYALAHIAPATPNEVAEFMENDTNVTNVSGTVTNVWRDGLIIRRKRRRPDKMGSDPYEYALRAVDE